jgi:integrase
MIQNVTSPLSRGFESYETRSHRYGNTYRRKFQTQLRTSSAAPEAQRAATEDDRSLFARHPPGRRTLRTTDRQPVDLYGLRFYYEHVLAKPWPAPGLVKPPRSQRLPDIVTVEEMQRLVSATRVLSYRVLFFTLYSLGLRLGEALRLEVGDIDGARRRVHIRNAKGNKDRFVPLPKATYSLLRNYWQVHRNPVLLFPSRAGGIKGGSCATTPLDRGGVAATLHQVVASCGLKKRSRPIPCATPLQLI